MEMNSTYWERRKNFFYYKRIIEISQHYARNAHSVIDIGNNKTEYILEFNWIPNKFVLDRDNRALIHEGLTSYDADFLNWKNPQKYDLVLCLQVLEHLANPELFAAKLFDICNDKVLISLPYKWPEGFCKYHKQDPIDEVKISTWIKKKPVFQEIVKEEGNIRRWIGLYKKG
jgi:hypothetical protein